MLITFLAFTVADNRSVYDVPLEAKAVCATDYDLDGDIDIIIEHGIDDDTNWGGIYIMENDGYGHFSFMDSIYDRTAGTVMYTDTILSKTNPDIVYKNNGYVQILSNEDGNYIHNSFYMGTNITKFNLGDIDNNGHLDVVFISNLEQYWGVIYNQGDDSFTEPTYYDLDYPPNDIACGELNGDGRCDVVVGGANSICAIYFSISTGFEMQPLQYNASYIKIADFDNDTDLDIITISDAYAMSFVHLYENLGNNIFDTINNFNINEGCAGFFIADFNNDNFTDVLFTTYFHNGGYLLYYNQGNFQFDEPQTIDITYYGEGWRSTYCADMDGNSFTDIITTWKSFDTTFVPSIVEILFNDGQGNFVDNPLTSIENNPVTNTETKFINYPNPFTNTTNIQFSLPKNANNPVLNIYDIYGKVIRQYNIADKNIQQWDGRDKKGRKVSAGIYLYNINYGKYSSKFKKLLFNN